MNYQLAYLDLAAQVRRLGIVADVQITDTEISFGDNHDERQMALAVMATVSTLNQLTLQLSNMYALNPDVCHKCGSDAVMLDAASGIRTCQNCGEGQ